jgi:phage terminase small subunit
MGKRTSMTPRQAAFVAHYLAGKSGVESARLAGYSPGSARTRSQEFLHENQHTMAAIAEAQAELRVEANYGAERALKELNDKIKQAEAAKQFSAVAKMVELKMKLSGLLEKDAAPTTAFQINIAGIDSPADIRPALPVVELETIFD